ncbi:putative uncharacterized protein [Pseudomonas sp. StFLB209]|uniref:DUF1654 domain-containing protein n=1 Tax=Pseudomonas sp. StFLB209 TaxID=1028989 RepID=UPI0004F84E97|nr:putative uncharacterized protein [Pseudomonas sp. StFLB209]
MLQCVPTGSATDGFTSYENLLRRVNRQLNVASQAHRHTVIARQPDECIGDWEAFLEQLDLEDSVEVTRIGRSAARLQWTNRHPG